MIEVVGHRVLIKPEHFTEEVKEGALKGFKLDIGEDWKREKAATVIGTIVSIGPTAWISVDDGRPWAAVGDKVYYAKYSGKVITEKDTDYIVCNDMDVIAKIVEAEDNE